MSDKNAPADFDPRNPYCQKCRTQLEQKHILFTIEYDGSREPKDFRGKSHTYVCPICGALNSVIVPDDLKWGKYALMVPESSVPKKPKQPKKPKGKR